MEIFYTRIEIVVMNHIIENRILEKGLAKVTFLMYVDDVLFCKVSENSLQNSRNGEIWLRMALPILIPKNLSFTMETNLRCCDISLVR